MEGEGKGGREGRGRGRREAGGGGEVLMAYGLNIRYLQYLN